ncbi:ANTAR domain-containing protein [Rhodococcus sp. IEGM 248]|uniref:PAS and ANTAR domain-containing protein n=1 Tax=Rhodococcus opacus TaxID=37919 RepID=UPI0013C21A31|nr:PAS and ANTAR domain-containing protein [Rhodococcus opacus]MDV7087057.1 PAS and ANTAR domain-containing protein [Rhodococcus opacus]NDV09086.1 ANTAR domain-containing protein [Rhodococcus sp. IEGM 248]
MGVAVDTDELRGSNAPPQGGSFRFYLDGQRWEWSDPVARMHGYHPGEVTPTTELLLSHKHPDDQPQVAALFDKVIHAGDPFSSKHRIIDTERRIHHVIVVGDRMLDENDQVIGTSGYYIDVTEALETDLREFNAALTEAVAELEQSRAVIEQAKGALMLVYGISSERAFGILTWRSQETNTKLHTLAGRFVDALAAEATLPESFRARFDHLLLTAHEHPDALPVAQD